MVNKAYQKVNL